MKQNGVNMKKKSEYLVCVLLFGILTFSLVVDVFNFNLPDCLKMKVSDVESFMNQLFGIQATISTLGIAVLAFLSDVIKEDFYGFKISEFIMEENRRIFKHKRIIISGFLGCLLNYIALSFRYYNFSIGIFLSSVILIIILVVDNMKIFKGLDNIKHDISKYIENNPNYKNINRVFGGLQYTVDNNDIQGIQDNILLLQSLFKKCAENHYTGSKVTKGLLTEYEKLIWQKLISIYRNTDGSYNYLLMELVISIYSEANKFKIYVDLWNKIMNENYLRKILYDNLEKDLIYGLHLKLYENYNFSKIRETNNFIDYKNNDLSNYSLYTYHFLFNENKIEFSSAQRNRLISNMYDDIKYILEKNKILNEEDNEILKLRNQYILFWEAIKYMVEMYRYHEVSCLQRIYNTVNDYEFKELKNLYNMSLIVYSYYVLISTTGERRNDIIKIIESNSDVIQEIIDNNEVNMEEIKILIKILQYGQVTFEGTLVDIKDIIYDFYVFILLLHNEPENTYMILKELFSGSNPYWLYDRYFNRVEEALENYGVFLKYYFWYHFTQEMAKERLNDLKPIIERICKEYELDKNKNLNIDFEEYKIKCINMFYSVIEPLNLRFNNIKFKNDIILNYNNKQFNKVINLRNMESSISRVINNDLTNHIFEVLKELLEEKELCKIVRTNLRQNRIKDFMSVIGESAENYDTIIGPNISGYGEYKEKFNNYLKGREFIRVPRLTYLVALDSKRLFINISIRNAKFLNLEWDEIINKEEGIYEGEWTYQTINNIRLNFNKDELQEFIDGIYRKLHIEYTIQIMGTSSNDECGIEF